MRFRLRLALVLAGAAALLTPARAVDVSYVYDVLGRVVQITYGAPVNRIVTYTYDAAGNIINVTVVTTQ